MAGRPVPEAGRRRWQSWRAIGSRWSRARTCRSRPRTLDLASSDKVLHFAAYGGLAVLLAANGRLRATWLHLAAWLAGRGAWPRFGALDEMTQPLFGRTADVLRLAGRHVGAVRPWVWRSLAFGGGLAAECDRWRRKRIGRAARRRAQ